MTIGSISSGTMRSFDLMPCFLGELASHDETRANEIEADVPELAWNDEDHAFWASDEAHWALESLWEALEEHALPYFYFGAHPGDGADYGFWLAEDFQQSMADDNVLQVNDFADVPADYRGEVLIVNDHGNCTFGHQSDDQFAVTWAVV